MVTNISNKSIIDTIAKEHNVSKAEAERIYNVVFKAIIDQIEKNEKEVTEQNELTIRLPIGVLRVVKTKAREGINPQDPNKKIHIPAKKKITLNTKLEDLKKKKEKLERKK